MQYSTILFDLDGTLIDSGAGIINSLAHAFDYHKIDYADLEMKKFIGPPIAEGLKLLLPDYFPSSDSAFLKQVIKTMREHYAEIGLYQSAVFAGVEEMLSSLKQKNKKLMIATSKPTVFSEKILANLNLAHYFDLIVGSNLDLTRSLKSEIISYILNNLKNKNLSSIVMVGDRHHDIEGAKENGIDSIGVCYGFGSNEELVAAKATYVMDDIASLNEFLITR